MNQQNKLLKKIRAMMIVMVVIMIPALMKLLGSNALAEVRTVDILMIFALGLLSGALLVTVISYLKIRKQNN